MALLLTTSIVSLQCSVLPFCTYWIAIFHQYTVLPAYTQDFEQALPVIMASEPIQSHGYKSLYPFPALTRTLEKTISDMDKENGTSIERSQSIIQCTQFLLQRQRLIGRLYSSICRTLIGSLFISLLARGAIISMIDLIILQACSPLFWLPCDLLASNLWDFALIDREDLGILWWSKVKSRWKIISRFRHAQQRLPFFDPFYFTRKPAWRVQYLGESRKDTCGSDLEAEKKRFFEMKGCVKSPLVSSVIPKIRKRWKCLVPYFDAAAFGRCSVYDTVIPPISSQ